MWLVVLKSRHLSQALGHHPLQLWRSDCTRVCFVCDWGGGWGRGGHLDSAITRISEHEGGVGVGWGVSSSVSGGAVASSC